MNSGANEKHNFVVPQPKDSTPALCTRSQMRRRSLACNSVDLIHLREPTASNTSVLQPAVGVAALKQVANQSQRVKTASAYGCFFRETSAKFKRENRQCNFPEMSKMVSSMWNAMSYDEKNVYFAKAQPASAGKQVTIAEKTSVKQRAEGGIEKRPIEAVMARRSTLPTPRTNPNARNNSEVRRLAEPEQKKRKKDEEKMKLAEKIFGDNDDKNLVAPFQKVNINAEDDKSAKMNAEEMLSVAGALKKCTRDGCNKRAVINPDWEDEYCSNECFVAHRLAVFTAFVKNKKK